MSQNTINMIADKNEKIMGSRQNKRNAGNILET